MADMVRSAGQAFIERSRKWINWQHRKVLLAIMRCRTAALGGHRDRCTGCGHTTAISYNSCRNRHCPRCQGNARRRWLKARERELLPTSYVHAVFTLPRELAPLALQNKRLIYNLLFHASAETLLEVARDPPLPAPSAAAWFRAHPQLRIPRQPQPRCIVAAVPAIAPQITAKHSYDSITVRRPDSLPLELSSLRRNHARCRTAHRRATAASFATPIGPMRRMNHDLQFRILFVPRRAGRFLVSSGYEPLVIRFCL
jgi:hypothetical protein